MSLRPALATALVEHGDPVLILDEQRVCRFVNGAARVALGLRRTPVGRHLDRIGPLAAPRFREGVRQTFASGSETSVEFSSAASGRVLRVRLVPVADGIAAFLRDVTELRAAERAAAQDRTQREAAEIAGAAGTFAWDMGSGEVRASEEALRIFGLDPASGPTTIEVTQAHIHPDDLALQQEGIARAVSDPGHPYQATFRTLRDDKGDVRLVLTVGAVVPSEDGPGLLVGSVTDITDQEAARQALITSEERLRQTLEGVDAIVSYKEDANARVVLNPPTELILGYAPEQIDSFAAWQALVHPDDLPACLAAWQSGKGRWELAYRMRRADGAWIWVVDRGRWIERGPGRGHGFFSVIVDATARILAQQAVSASEARYRAATDSAVDAIITCDTAGTIIACNPSAERMLGWRPAGLIGVSIRSVLSASDADRVAAWADDYLVGRIGLPVGSVVEVRGQRHDGTGFPAELSIGAWEEDGATYFTGIIRDISERRASEDAARELESRLRQSQRLEALGQLAGGVAHDMNNILSAIGGYAAFVKEAVAPGSREASDVEQVLLATERASSLTRQLLAFSRRQPLELRVVNVADVIDALGPMLQRLLGPEIEMRITRDPAVGRVLADPGQVEQVVMNLAVNARDAMPGGGVLHIDTRNAPRSASGPRDSGALRISVSDTGIGMDAHTRERIFEPFFTTKPVGKGTGLGLATVYGIVEASGGRISVTSSPGAGSIFTIDLPRAEQAADADAAAGCPAARPSGAGQRVLVVEDDPAVRRLLERTVEGLGYRCMSAGSGEAALKLVTGSTPPDAVVSDVRMPGLQGPELVRRIRATVSRMPVILVTGLSGRDLDLGETAALQPFAILEKPVRADVLGATLGRLLSQPAP